MKLIKNIKLNVFKEVLSQITQRLKLQRDKYYFMVYEDGKKKDGVSDEIYEKWEKLERNFDMFYEINLNLEEIFKISKQ